MEVNYLHLDELDWELKVRGAIVQANMDIKRRLLRGHLQSEKLNGKFSHPEVPLDFQAESMICNEKLVILEGMIGKFNSDKKHPDYKRIITKLCHLKNRIDYFPCNNQLEANLKTDLLTKNMLLLDLIEQKVTQTTVSDQDLLTFDKMPTSNNMSSHSSPINSNEPLRGHVTSELYRESIPERSHVSLLNEALDNTPPVSSTNNIYPNLNEINRSPHNMHLPISSNCQVPQHQLNVTASNFNSGPVVSNNENIRNQSLTLQGERGAYVNTVNTRNDCAVSIGQNHYSQNIRSVPNNVNPIFENNQIFTVSSSLFCNGPSSNSDRPDLGNAYPAQNVNLHNNLYNSTNFKANNMGFPPCTNLPNAANNFISRDHFSQPFSNNAANNFNFRGHFSEPYNAVNQVNFQSGFSSTLSYINRTNLKFSGTNQSVHNFLDKINEFCLAYGVDKARLLNVAHEFFEGDALHWFRANRNLFTSWDDLVYGLKFVFLPCDFELDLWKEIFARTQGSAERVLIYISIMENLFSHLSSPPSESFKLQLILRNLQPYFQYQLSLRPPVSLVELKYLCRNIEDTKIRTEKFKEPPPCTFNTLEPELAYRNSNTTRNKVFVHELQPMINHFENLALPDVSHQSEQVNAIKTVKCWNCDAVGHIYNKCDKAKTKFCYGCGAKNVIKPKCIKCNPKNEVITVIPPADTV